MYKRECAMLLMNSRKRQITKGIEISNQERIRTFEEKKITITTNILRGQHQTTEAKKNKQRSTSDEPENCMKHKSVADISSIY